MKKKQVTVPWKADNAWHDLVLVTEGDKMHLNGVLGFNSVIADWT